MRNAKLVAILILTVLLGIIVLQNRDPVQTRLLLVTVEMPQILLLVLTAGAGFVLGLLVSLVVRGKASGKTPPVG
jgi:uncharacterized integral membrane protein